MSQAKLENAKLKTPETARGAAIKLGQTAAQSTPSLADELEAERIRGKVGALVMGARRAQHKGRKDEARKLLKQAFSIDANDCGALELLGDLFMEDGEQEKALKIFERGLNFHPKHAAFEQKIALCHVDLDEMRRDRDRRAQILEQGGIEKWQLLSTSRAFTLSALLPGAGQAYVGKSERGLSFLGAAIFSFLCWSLPLYFGLKGARADGVRNLGDGFGAALGSMNGLGLLWFWGMFAGWIVVYGYAAFDALSQAEKVNELRKQGWEVFED